MHSDVKKHRSFLALLFSPPVIYGLCIEQKSIKTRKMETFLIIGKSVIRKYFDYYEKYSLDDETEFFPALKIIILGIIDASEDDKQKGIIEKQLKEYARELYCKLWIQHANEDEVSPDIEFESKEAIQVFNRIYKKQK